MHLVIDSADQFSRLLSAAMGAAVKGKGTESKVESAVLLEACDNQLRVTAVNPNSHQLSLVTPARVLKEGKCLISPSYMQKIAGRLGQQQITLQLAGSQFVLDVQGSSNFSCATFQGDVNTFPKTEDIPPLLAEIEGSSLHEALNACLKCLMKDQQEVVFMHIGDVFNVLTSDYISLASTFQTADAPSKEFAFKIPGTALGGTKTPNWTGTVGVHVDPHGRRVAFTSGENHLLITSVTPDVDEAENVGLLSNQILQLLEQPSSGSVVVKRQKLIEELRIIAMPQQVCEIRVTGKGHKFLSVVSVNLGVSKSNVRVPLEGDIIGETPVFRMSTELLLRLASSVDGDDCVFEYVSWGTDDHMAIRLSNQANPSGRRGLAMTVQEQMPDEGDSPIQGGTDDGDDD